MKIYLHVTLNFKKSRVTPGVWSEQRGASISGPNDNNHDDWETVQGHQLLYQTDSVQSWFTDFGYGGKWCRSLDIELCHCHV